MAIKVIRGLNTVAIFIDRIFKYISGFLLLFIVFSISLSVIMRYFFNIPLSWSVEVSEYIMIYITFLTIAWALHIDGHVKIELLTTRMPPKIRRSMTVITYLITAAAFLIVCWFSTVAAIDMYHRNVVLLVTLAIPKFFIMLPISVGSFLFSIRSILKIFDNTLLQEKHSEGEAG